MEELEPYFDTEIPEIVYVLAFLAMSVAMVITFITKRKVSNTMRSVMGILLVGYCFLVLCSTVLCRNTFEEYQYEFSPFYSYTAFQEGDGNKPIWEMLLNVVLFLPIGFLVSSFRGFRGSGDSNCLKSLRVVLFDMCFSMTIELLQLMFKKGMCETNDVIHNTLGCLVG